MLCVQPQSIIHMNKQYFFLVIILFFSATMSAQDGFRYQAVIRDNAGAIVANQTVALRFGVIENLIGNTPTYVETHTPTSDAYGHVSLTIGGGTTISGTFSAIDWSKPLFLNTELDLANSGTFTQMGTAELLTVPKAYYAERVGNADCAGLGFCVKDYGAKGDNTTDDTNAFNLALAAASIDGNRVTVPAGNYLIASTLIIPDGVTIVGEGVGEEPLQTPYNGSAIRYAGTGYAVQLSGHTSGIRDMLIYDQNQGSSAAGGIHILGDGELVESNRLFNVLIQYFTGGTALYLEAINAGGVTYNTFYSVRIRNAKTGIRIRQDASSFVNSNVWHHGAISGGGFDYGILVESGNNNQFYGTIIEPYVSTFGHLIIQGGEIQGENIRIEGNGQPATTPLVHCFSGTKNTNISGTYAGGLTLDEGDNFIGFRTGKATDYFDSRSNLFENSTFEGFDGTDLPYWDITGNAAGTTELLTPELTPNHKVLKLTIPAGQVVNLEQAGFYVQNQGNLPLYEQVNFGMYVKVAEPDVAYLRVNSTGGVTVSQAHHGDGKWHFVGMTQNLNPNTTLDARLEINNTTGGNLEVYVSVPTMNFGNQSPDISPKPITSAGGIMTGTLSHGYVEFTPTSTFIVLEKNANVVRINGTQAIHRINHSGNDKFPRGTILTLLFTDAGLDILDNVYIDTYSNFSSLAGSSLTLLANGNGTWSELSRNL